MFDVSFFRIYIYWGYFCLGSLGEDDLVFDVFDEVFFVLINYI